MTSTSDIKMATLKDGTEVPNVVLSFTMQRLEAIKKIDSIALYRLSNHYKDFNPYSPSKKNLPDDLNQLLVDFELLDPELGLHPKIISVISNSISGPLLIDPRARSSLEMLPYRSAKR